MESTMKTTNLYRNIIALFFIALSLVSCEKNVDSDNISKITYYPTFEMTGEELQIIPLGTPYTDPGIVATENGQEIPVATSVVGTIQTYSGTAVNSDLANEYLINYSATNSDGFQGNAARTVWVVNTGDLVTSIEGLYTSTVVRNGAVNPQYADMSYILIYKTGDNTYEISDGIGGYYDLGRAYGPTYRATPCVVTAVDIPGNNFTYGGAFGVGAFGGSAEISGLTVDPVAKTVSFSTSWDAGYTFVVTLTQVNI
jgi:hypothetical protein